MTIEIKNIENLKEAAREFLKALDNRKVVAFEAPMGAGKTTFISAVCRLLGVEDDVNSPTFSIVNEYVGGDGESIYHFDCYRLESTAEAHDMGAEDYLESGNLCLIEWPEYLDPLLPENTVRVSITVDDRGIRTLHID
ncbi:MAG: tRNA (adenosine(37)-N6)-threonylcarbamoyltransferase complex ATPase subunit type 1 TsaE [Clostridium sp.]|nr:tRNA (adenosine(37)-N6)-threonylcarbamoyltransferase complex ATPase subunit type 1 TsaE [Prevotella sp.]MCM1429107.1 tRNA (adenosine(37)-N6)-threonylcarbamoyltransferase complex ATPase subunit type 1 TsaE [Clostridium sp.]MCM1475364.1 tRNA (adenosine(37)-N6)-threonylcarbamoyltransferase complex ATPase subunit type 1 TsaE [Muribaculaceae bacterium]